MTRVRKAVFPRPGSARASCPPPRPSPRRCSPRGQAHHPDVVEEAVASGLDEIILVTGRNKRAIEDHFDAAFELEYYLQDRGKGRRAGPDQDDIGDGLRLLRATEGAARPRSRHSLRPAPRGG